MQVIAACLFNSKCNRSASIRKLHGIGQDVDEDLLQLQLIEMVGPAKTVCHDHSITDTFFLGAFAYERVDRIQEPLEMDILFIQLHAAAFDAGNIQDIIDQAQQEMS